ncbi:MAG: Mysoin-binding motif of peroxisomes-domain-containing protein [Benniella sp.]|nr:MAG: Mysoin-binding motif of peroxisomes-domain-containing protein [Benniella sp.]
MADIVIYEDSPLAQYLQGNNQPSHKFSSSEADSEDAEFEERFKYLICTSPFLNRTVTLHAHERGKRNEVPMTVDFSRFHLGRSGYMLGFGTLATLMARSALNRTRFARLPFVRPFLGRSAAISVALASNIHATQNQALRLLQLLMSQCQTLDAKVNRAIMIIQEIELVSRGYRLSTPLAPISRIEQASKSRRCNMVRAQLVAALTKSGALFQRTTETLQSHIDPTRLNTLLDMYNITPSSRPGSPQNDEDNADTATPRPQEHHRHGHRHGRHSHTLAIKDYDRNWTVVRDVLQEGVTGIQSVVDELSKVLDSELCKVLDDINGNSAQDKQLQPFVQRLALLEQHVRGVQAKLFICNEDIRDTAHEEPSDSDKRRLLEIQYESISQDISMMAAEWELGRVALTRVFDPSLIHGIPRPRFEEQESPIPQQTHGMNDDYSHTTGPASTESDLVGFPSLSRRADAFVGPDGVKMTRAERIQHQKKLREQEEVKKERAQDSTKMVHELKNVLGRRRHLREGDDGDQDHEPSHYQQHMASMRSSPIPAELPSTLAMQRGFSGRFGMTDNSNNGNSTGANTNNHHHHHQHAHSFPSDEEHTSTYSLGTSLYSHGSDSFVTSILGDDEQVEESYTEITGVGEAEEEEEEEDLPEPQA